MASHRSSSRILLPRQRSTTLHPSHIIGLSTLKTRTETSTSKTDVEATLTVWKLNQRVQAACGVSLQGAQSSHPRVATRAEGTTGPGDGPFPHSGGRTGQWRGAGSWGDPTSGSSALDGEEEKALRPACGTPTARLAPGRGRGHSCSALCRPSALASVKLPVWQSRGSAAAYCYLSRSLRIS